MKKMYFFGKNVGNFGVLLTIVFLFFLSGGLKAQNVVLFDGTSLENSFGNFAGGMSLDNTEWSPNSTVQASVKIDNSGGWGSGDFWDNTDNLVFENVDLVNGSFTIDYKTTDVTHIKGFSLLDWSNGCTKVATVLGDGGQDYTGLVADGQWHTLTIQFDDAWSQDYIDCFSPADQINPRIKIQVGTAGVIWFDHAVYNEPPPTYALTVENGTGNGDYEEGAEVNIAATVPAGFLFNGWSGDVANVADVNAAETTITMSAQPTTVTANFKVESFVLFDGESLQNDFSQFTSIELDATEWSPNSNVQASVKIDNGSWNSGNFWDNTDNMVFEEVDLVNGVFTIDYKTNDVTHIKGFSIQDWSNGCSKVATLLQDGGHDYTGLIADGQWHTLTIQFNETWSQDYIDCFSPTDQINPRIIIQVGTGGVIWFDHAVYNAVAPTYALTVENGTGGGNYEDGEQVAIEANAPVAGQMFDQWTGDVTNVDDVNASSTFVTMSTEAATITATYVDIPTYTLTVENGTGSGDYEEGVEVNIEATVPVGSTFSAWTGDVANVADVNAAATTITMPAQAVTVTADIVTGINQVDLVEGITILPNPVKDGSLRINSEVTVSNVTVVSLAGVEVLQKANVGSKDLSLNVSGLAAGQYLVKIITSDGDIVVKSFVKQ